MACVTVDHGTQLALVEVTDWNDDIGCHDAFFRDDYLEFNVSVFANPSLTRDCPLADKDILVCVVKDNDAVPLLNHFRIPTTRCLTTILVLVLFL